MPKFFTGHTELVIMVETIEQKTGDLYMEIMLIIGMDDLKIATKIICMVLLEP